MNKKPSIHPRPKVVFENPVIPHYRIAFFAELAKHVDLLVVASENKKVDGLHDVRDGLPFKSLRLPAQPQGGIFHPDLLHVLEEEKPDILISWTTSLIPLLTDVTSYAKLKSLGIKIGLMGCDGYLYQNFLWGLLLNLLDPRQTFRTIREIICMSRIDFFIPHSSHAAGYLHDMRFVPKRKIHMVHNAIDTSVLTEVYRRNKTQGKARDPERIAFTGRLTTRKGLVVLLEALTEVLKIHPRVTLSIIGEGSEKDTLEKIVRDLGISNSVFFVGPLYDDGQLAEELYQASLFVLPGLGGLGFNTAMALGLPIIHTHADGTEKDMILEGKNGWYFDGTSQNLAAKINFALSDPQRLIAMGELSEKLITEEFTLEHMVQGYAEAIYGACLRK